MSSPLMARSAILDLLDQDLFWYSINIQLRGIHATTTHFPNFINLTPAFDNGNSLEDTKDAEGQNFILYRNNIC